MLIGVVGAALLLLAISALLSAADAAAGAVSETRVRTLRDEGFGGADALVELRTRSASVRMTVLVLNTLGDVTAAGLLVFTAVFQWGVPGAALGVPAGALVILFLGEILPRGLASRHPVRLGLRTAPLLLFLERAMRPILVPLLRLEDMIARRPRDAESVSAAERELLEITALGQEEGVVGEDEHRLVERAFQLDELTVWDAMTPRVEIFALSDALTLGEVIHELKDVPYSRVPVFGESVDYVTGIVSVREAYETHLRGRTEVTLSRIAREPFFVPGSLSLARLLKDFQGRRIHMGIVADEYGGTDGLITLEDVLEELVGEIVDETDHEEDPIQRISRWEVVVDAALDLREINYLFNVSLPTLDHRSLNGFLLEELGKVPEPGERIERDGLEIEILGASETQVERARVKRLPAGRDSGKNS